jgi:3',5'-cyclic AMP phosphodiesterase CpdA
LSVRGSSLGVALVAGSLVLTGCTSGDGDVGTSRAAAPSPGPVKIVAAGDIGKSPTAGELTAQLVESRRPDAVLTLGDNAYERGSLEEYLANYHPTWGRFKRITRPVPGNHEYGTPEAAGYFDYFGRRVADRPYYAWNAGTWRMYALNCEIDCGDGSAQLRWLTRDLARHRDRPALAYLHRPRYTCSKHAPMVEVSPIWKALQRARGRLMLSGHNHVYERFAKQNANGRRAKDGLRQFVVGTGGAEPYELTAGCANRQASTDANGVLVLELGPNRYRWKFVDVDGRVRDRGRGRA